MKSLRLKLAAVAAFCVMSVAAFAADPSGTWKWSTPGRNGGPARESTLTLTAKDGKLTGKVANQGRNGPVETEISNATVKDDTVSFEVTREFNGNSFTTKYTGKVEGDTLKGSITLPGFGGGEPRTIDWEAKREAAK